MEEKNKILSFLKYLFYPLFLLVKKIFYGWYKNTYEWTLRQSQSVWNNIREEQEYIQMNLEKTPVWAK
jgi:hypothetical protein